MGFVAGLVVAASGCRREHDEIQDGQLIEFRRRIRQTPAPQAVAQRRIVASCKKFGSVRNVNEPISTRTMAVPIRVNELLEDL